MPFNEFQLEISPSTLKISSHRIDSPLLFPFDHKPKTKIFYIDFLLIKEGISLYCNRLKGTHFIQFVRTNSLAQKCLFKLSNGGQEYSISLNPENPTRYFIKIKMDSKGIIQKIEHGRLLPSKERKSTTDKKKQKLYTMINTVMGFLDLVKDDKQAVEHFKDNFIRQGGPEFEGFLDLLSMGTTFVSEKQREIYEKNQQIIQERGTQNDSIKSLLDTILAAATFIEFLIPSRQEETKIEMTEEKDI